MPAFACSTGTTVCRRLASERRVGRRRSRSSRSASRNTPVGFSVLYLGSNWLPRDLGPLLGLARRRGVPFVLNQDGVAYPAWAGEQTEALNAPLRRASAGGGPRRLPERVREALGRSASSASAGGSWEILPNAVDVDRFTPREGPPPVGGPVLLLGGDQTQPYRVELAVETLAALARATPGGGAARDGAAGVGRGGARRSARASGARPPARRVRAARRARHLPPRASAPAHEGERSLPDARARGHGVRAAGRVSGERRDGRARGGRGGRGRAASGELGAGRASVRGGARGGRGAGARGSTALRGGGAGARGRALRARALARPPRRALRVVAANLGTNPRPTP